MNQFNFKSQIATTIEQSERLIALGLKKETADMFHNAIHNGNKVVGYRVAQGYNYKHFDVFADDIPAWSLHRLIEILDTNPCVFYTNCGYDNIIDRIEELIKEGYFPKEYLV